MVSAKKVLSHRGVLCSLLCALACSHSSCALMGVSLRALRVLHRNGALLSGWSISLVSGITRSVDLYETMCSVYVSACVRSIVMHLYCVVFLHISLACLLCCFKLQDHQVCRLPSSASVCCLHLLLATVECLNLIDLRDTKVDFPAMKRLAGKSRLL